MEIKVVIKNLKAEVKQVKAEIKESKNYLKDKETPQQLAWIEEKINDIDDNYVSLLDIAKEGNKARLVKDINNSFELLSSIYAGLSFNYAMWVFLRDLNGIEEINYVDAKRDFFREKSNALKEIKY
ncbi:MAG: hypothetical protein WCQ65_10220 [Fermentimonas sp.]